MGSELPSGKMPSPQAAASPDVWVGPGYAAGFSGQRLLIVGEATPNAQGRFRIGIGLEAKLTGQYVDGDIKHRAFTDLARMSLGEPAPRERCEEFFRQIAFANLRLQRKTGGTSADGVAALQHDFNRLLRDLEPSVVLVLGAPLGNALSEEVLTAAATYTLLHAPHPGAVGFAFRDHVEATAPLRKAAEQAPI